MDKITPFAMSFVRRNLPSVSLAKAEICSVADNDTLTLEITCCSPSPPVSTRDALRWLLNRKLHSHVNSYSRITLNTIIRRQIVMRCGVLR